jgi:hypothetical protein
VVDRPGKIDESYPHEDEDAPSHESHGTADIKKCLAADLINGKTVITGKSHRRTFLLRLLSIDFVLLSSLQALQRLDYAQYDAHTAQFRNLIEQVLQE